MANLQGTLPIKGPNYLSQHPSFTFTEPGSHYGLHNPGLTTSGTWLGPSQEAHRPLPTYQTPTSSDLRSPTLSHEISNTKSSPSLENYDPSYASVTSTPRSNCGETVGSPAEGSRIAKLPQRSKIFKSEKLADKFGCHGPFEFDTELPPSTSTNVVALWKWEIFNCVLAIGMLGSMYGILRRFDGQRIPDWGTTINLSTLVALIATLLRGLLIFVVAEIIGQAKWKYFAGNGRPAEDPPTRRLIETSRFYDASQGALGAMKLLPTIIRDPATLVAAVVMIVSLGTGSFVQQAIQTQSCQFPVDSVNASLPISRNISARRAGGGSTFGPVDIPNVAAAMSSALGPDSEEIDSSITVGCPTGNCTFRNAIGGMYSTLGVCTSCTDASSLITSTGWTLTRDESAPIYNPSTGEYTLTPATFYLANYTLPNKMTVHASVDNISSSGWQGTEFVSAASAHLGLEWAGDLVSPEMKALSQWAFANVTILSPTWLPTSLGYTDYVVAACTLYPCLRSYNASVTAGKLDEVLVSTVPAVPNVAAVFEPDTTTEAIQEEISGPHWENYIYGTSPGAHFQAIQSPCLVNGTVWTRENKSSTLDMQRLLLLHADPNPGGARRFTVENTTAPSECIYGMDVVAETDFSRLMIGTSFGGRCTAQSLGNGTERTTQIECGKAYWLAGFYNERGTTASSIIKRIESFTDRLSNKIRMGLLNSPETVSGQVLQVTVCSRIQYGWLTFPAVLVAVTSGLLAWTMFWNSRHRGCEMVWKTSILPFLFYGERFVVQNGEDVSAYSIDPVRGDRAKEPLLDLDRMKADARQQKVRFDAYN